MSKDNVFIGKLGPLAFVDADPIPGQKPKKLTFEDILKYISSETLVPEVDNYIKSYKHVSENINKLFIAPMEASIVNKLIYPLKSAIGSYMVGNYLGTIALCGMVAEMAVIFHYDTLKIQINEKTSDQVVKKIYNRKFEKLGQEQRVNFLNALGFLKDSLVENFDIVRETRRQYLHFLSKDISGIAPDAKKAFDATLDIVVSILGLRIGEPGKIVLNQNVIDYLNSKGLIQNSNKEKE